MDRKQYVLTVALSMIAGMAGGVLASQLFMGTPLFPWKTPLQVEVIRAERFEVVDKDGKRRAALALVKGEPSLALFNQNGNPRAGLALVKGEPILVLADENVKGRAILSLIPDGEPSLIFSDKDGETIWEAP